MQGLGELVPLLSLSTRAERAAVRAERALTVREKRFGQRAHLDLDDGLALTPDGEARLTGCHRTTYLAHDWAALAEREEMPDPVRGHRREKKARRELATYAPSWQERVFAEEAQRRRELTEQVMASTHADAEEHRAAVASAEAHNDETRHARRMLAFDPHALQEAVAASGLADLHDSLNSLNLARPEPARVVVVADVIQEQDIPNERITSASSRDARRELMADMERRRLHVRAVSAVALRVGAELVGLLPVEQLEVIVLCEVGDDSGEVGPAPILRFRISREQVQRLNWAEEASGLLRALAPQADWRFERGFRPTPPAPAPAAERPAAQTG
jgi:hypothetical protein